MSEWRTAGLAGLTLGVGLSPLAERPQIGLGLAVLVPAVIGLVLLRPGAGHAWTWTGAFALVLLLGGLLLGSVRLAAIDDNAYRGPVGAPATVTGTVAAVPRRSRGEVRVEIETGDGRLLVVAPEPVPDLRVGGEVRARGFIGVTDPFLAPLLRRHGIAQMLAADRVEPTRRRRGGVAGALDLVRSRAEVALEQGMRDPEAALARGFVLGQDDRIDPATIDDFKRSGLAHLLAVSGQNVVLLALLAMPLLALAGLSLRARLFCVLALIALYVPVAGAGPSIQRAGAMGAAGVVAALAGRPRSRVYVVFLAAFATLVLNPRASGEIGWQLSFAAVIGILLWSRRLSALLGGGERGGWRRALAEGAAITVAATVATAPLMAHHFDAISIAALPANLLALPAVAPAMWLGMLAAAAGQLPVPASQVMVEPLNAVNQLLLAYIEQVAHELAKPSWAVAPLRLGSVAAVAAAYAALIAGAWLGFRAAERRRGLRAVAAPAPGAGASTGRSGWRRRGLPVALPAVIIWATTLAPTPGGSGREAEQPPEGVAEELSVSVLDVGQGDAILLQPPGGGALLVDGGPPGDRLRELLAERGVERLAAAIVTHDQNDHSGGILELLGTIPIGSLAYAAAGPELLGAAEAAGADPIRIAEGSELRSGELRLAVLWPPRELAPSAGSIDDPNRLSLVILAEWRHFSLLLTGDAEAEATGVEPGPVDVLKVAHHGSADAGLEGLLDHSLPDLAVISVGEGNAYGHPAPETLSELREHSLHTLRTDESGTIEIDAGAVGWTVARGQ